MSSAHTQASAPRCENAKLRLAVQAWLDDEQQATRDYGDIRDWDVSKVTDMSGLFANARTFNAPLNTWNVANVTKMTGMFYNASSFNQPLHLWDVSRVTHMEYMFYGASRFNQPLTEWTDTHVEDVSHMFTNACSFNVTRNAPSRYFCATHLSA